MTSLQDFLLTGTGTLANKYLVVKTGFDGLTKTWNGYHIYKVNNSGNNYSVVEQDYDDTKGDFEDEELPIIDYDGTTLFFVTGTNSDPYNGATTLEDTTATSDNITTKLGTAFLAFAEGEFSTSNYNVFLEDSVVLDDLNSGVDPVTAEEPTTVAPTTETPTTTAG